MKKYFKVDTEYGIPIDPTGFPLFSAEQEKRAEQILKSVEGLRICTALCLLEKCKEALMQSTVDVD